MGTRLKGHVMHKFGMINWKSKNREKVKNRRARLLEKDHGQTQQRLLKNKGRQRMTSDNGIWQGKDDFQLK